MTTALSGGDCYKRRTMMIERRQSPPQSPAERDHDLDWIAENRDVFWLSATTAFEEIGRGALLVDLIHEPLEQGHPFSYHAEGELEIEDEDLKHYLDDYDPGREFIVVLLKPDSRAIYCGRRPDIGWMADLRTRTQYKPEVPVKEDDGRPKK